MLQLQDDILGVFGDPERTGKPARATCGKESAAELILHAMELLPTEDRQVFDNSGQPGLSADDVSGLQKMLEDCGARERVTQEVESLGAQALEALSTFDLDGGVVGPQALTEPLLHRQH